MRAVLRLLFHHLTILGLLYAVSTGLSFLAGAAFFFGGSSWEYAVELMRFLSAVLLVPVALIWLNNFIRELRSVLRVDRV